MFAHGGMFRTAGVAQRFLAAALGAPVTVSYTASKGGAWGIAALAEYLRAGVGEALSTYVAGAFAEAKLVVAEPEPTDVEGYAAWLKQYSAGLAIEMAATKAIR